MKDGQRGGVKFINLTPHPITFSRASDGAVYEIPASGQVLHAEFRNEPAGTHASGVALVTPRLVPAPGSLELLARIEAENPGGVIVGSLIAAQTFPGRVVALISAAGFERLPAAQKRMRDDLFTIF